MPRIDYILQHFFRVAPERIAAVGDMLITRDDAVVCYTMLVPSRALRAAVEQHRLKAIDRGGEFRLGGLFLLELVPQRAKFLRLIGREQTKDPFRRDGLAFMLV